MNQHICLFSISNQLDRKKQHDFFYRMCTALGYNAEKATSLGTIYAHYGIFDGKVLTPKEYQAIQERLQPCKDCNALKKKAIYKSFNISENACPLCVFSSDYKNAREKDEMYVLRYLMKKTASYEYYQINSELAFTSLKRLAPDYTIGDYPIIPFNLYLYLYLDNHSIHEMGVDAFFDGFLVFILKQFPYVFDIEQYREPIRVCFDSILSIDEKTITDDVYALSAERLRVPYAYEPPSFTVSPTSAGTPSAARKKPRKKIRKEPELDNQTTLFDYDDTLSKELFESEPTDNSSPDVISVDKATNLSSLELFSLENILKAEETKTDTDMTLPQDVDNKSTDNADTHTEGETETEESVSDNDAAEDIPEMTSEIIESIPDDIKDNEEQEIVDNFTDDEGIVIEADNTDIGLPSIDDIQTMFSTDIIDESETYAENTKDIVINDNNHKQNSNTKLYDKSIKLYDYNINSPLDYYTYTSFSKSFDNEIEVITRNSSFHFIAQLDQNFSIAIEPVLYHERSGLLIYLHLQDKFFFYDCEVFGNFMISDYLQRNDTILLTRNAVYTMALLELKYENSAGLHDIDAMYWVLNSGKEPTLSSLISKYTTVDEPYSEEKALMHYQTCFLHLKQELSDNSLNVKYHRILRLYSVLSHTIEYSFIFHKRIAYLKQSGFLKFGFSFKWSDRVYVSGQIFRISIPDIEDTGVFEPDSFLTDICLCFTSLHHSNQQHVHLLSISPKAIYVFHDGSYEQAMRFYDSIILRLQTAYKKRFNKILCSNTTYVLYE